MNGAIIGVFLVIIAYLVMMLAIGFFYSKGNNDSSDFYLGGRKLVKLVLKQQNLPKMHISFGSILIKKN